MAVGCILIQKPGAKMETPGSTIDVELFRRSEYAKGPEYGALGK